MAAGSGIRGKTREIMLTMARDVLAESLENKSLWRRASLRWLALVDKCDDDGMRELYVQRREYCIEKANTQYRLRNLSTTSDKADLVEAKRGIDAYYRKNNFGSVSNFYLDWN